MRTSPGAKRLLPGMPVTLLMSANATLSRWLGSHLHGVDVNTALRR
jgi:hypothetical protein